MTRLSSVVLIALAVAASGCHRDPLAPTLTTTALVSAARVESGIRLTNNTGQPVAYTVSNPNWLGLLALCADPGPECVKLAPGASVVVPLSAIYGHTADAKQATVFWWHVVPDGKGGYTQDEVATLFVQL